MIIGLGIVARYTNSTPDTSPLPGTAADAIIVVTDETVRHIQEIFARGQEMGNNPRVFAKVGDSITASSAFLQPIGRKQYNLGIYTHLQPVIDHFTPESFARQPAAAEVGWAAYAVLDPSFNKAPGCLVNETPLACEYRQMRPAIALIMYGTNDSGYRPLEQFRADLLRIVDVSTQMGVIPVLSTIPPRPDVSVEAFNTVIREVTQARHIPLWDYHQALLPLPAYGLSPLDNLHPSSPGFDAAANFIQPNLQHGYVMRNLTALQALYIVSWYLDILPL